MPKYKGSLLDESCKFMINSQMNYAKQLNLPWGISEAAFNLKDLHSNYQYKAFGIPWLGLKRGLASIICFRQPFFNVYPRGLLSSSLITFCIHFS